MLLSTEIRPHVALCRATPRAVVHGGQPFVFGRITAVHDTGSLTSFFRQQMAKIDVWSLVVESVHQVTPRIRGRYWTRHAGPRGLCRRTGRFLFGLASRGTATHAAAKDANHMGDFMPFQTIWATMAPAVTEDAEADGLLLRTEKATVANLAYFWLTPAADELFVHSAAEEAIQLL